MVDSIVCGGKVPCEAVFKELKEKTPFVTFKWVVGGLGVALLLIAGLTAGNIKSSASVQAKTLVVLAEIQSDVKVIQVELKYLNGRKKRRVKR